LFRTIQTWIEAVPRARFDATFLDAYVILDEKASNETPNERNRDALAR
jgi:hypothetical protein